MDLKDIEFKKIDNVKVDPDFVRLLVVLASIGFSFLLINLYILGTEQWFWKIPTYVFLIISLKETFMCIFNAEKVSLDYQIKGIKEENHKKFQEWLHDMNSELDKLDKGSKNGNDDGNN